MRCYHRPLLSKSSQECASFMERPSHPCDSLNQAREQQSRELLINKRLSHSAQRFMHCCKTVSLFCPKSQHKYSYSFSEGSSRPNEEIVSFIICLNSSSEDLGDEKPYSMLTNSSVSLLKAALLLAETSSSGVKWS